MNEKLKTYIGKQHQKLIDDLTNTFNLPIFVDEIAEDELPADNHYFLIVYGDMVGTGQGQVFQEVYVVYISENNLQVEENTVDIISIGSKVPGFTFKRSVKERFQKEDTDNFFDQVTIIFRRKLIYEY
jgi:hypothetical protein